MANIVLGNDETGTTILIVCACVLGVVLIVVLFFLLDKFFFSKKKCKRQLKALDRKYEYLHALLTGQDFQYVQRIEIISRTNLLYSDIYSVYFKRYKDIRDHQEVSYQEVLNKLAQLVNKSDVKGFKKYYKESLATISAYETSVNSLNNDLIKVIKPEEDARQNSLVLKDKFRAIKSKYNSHESELVFVSETFSKIFEMVDERFTKFEGYVETADYDDANNLLPEITNVLNVLDGYIDDLPGLIKTCNDDIPSELGAIKEHYNELVRDDYPLKQLNFEQASSDIETDLETISESIKQLKLKKVQDDLNEIKDRLEKIKNQFQAEEDACKEFKENSPRVYSEFNNLEKEFIKVRNNMFKYGKIYIINKEHSDILIDIQRELDDVSKDKRRLDMYVHSLEKTPYSILIEKMRDLDAGTHDIINRFNDFKAYLRSLKTDCESAFGIINDTFFKMKNVESILRGFYNDDFVASYKDRIDRTYKIEDEVCVLLNSVPINVDLVNADISELINTGNAVINEVSLANKNKKLAAQEIEFMNRERVKFSDVNSQLYQCEQLFLDCNYADAYKLSLEIEKRLESKGSLE